VQTVGGTWLRSRLTTAAALAILCCSFVGASTTAKGQEAGPRQGAVELKHGLQGARFAGSLRVQHQTEADAEVLTFKDGEFSSSVCLKYGYPPAPYWVRRDTEGLHFLATLRNPENGTIRFEGVFDGETMRATALWTKERWYWTVKQTLVFTGRPVGAPE
jgi:hypothetical protein